jgi:ABC-2 type transport system ATP-binding protein
LILDEPTSGLDPNQIVEIREVIRRLGQNKTVLFSSHIMQEVEAICDRVIIINKGTIVADDKLQNLQRSSTGKQYVTVEFKEAVDVSLLKKLKDVIEVKNVQSSIFSIQCSNADSVRKQLLQLSIDHNLNIVSLQSETQNLESVFKSLTS